MYIIPKGVANTTTKNSHTSFLALSLNPIDIVARLMFKEVELRACGQGSHVFESDTRAQNWLLNQYRQCWYRFLRLIH
jgi:hypothetical protein